MPRSYTIEELDDLIDRRVNKHQTLEEMAEETPYSFRELLKINKRINTLVACKHCGRPVPINNDVRKQFCNHTCISNHYNRGTKLIDLGLGFVPGRKFVLTLDQIKDAAMRYIEFDDNMTDIAKDLGVSPSTLIRTLKECGIKINYKHFSRTTKSCKICGKLFQGIKSALYCGSGACRGKAYYQRKKAREQAQ